MDAFENQTELLTKETSTYHYIDDKWKKEEDRILLRDIFYLFIVLWLSVFIAEYFFLDRNSTPFDRIFGYIIIFLPLGTLNFFLHYLYRNRKVKLTGKFRSSLRYRLILAFLVVSIIPAMPIFLLTSSKVESIISIFFKLDLKGSLQSSETLLEFYEEKYAENFYNQFIKNKNDLIFLISKLNEQNKEILFKILDKYLNSSSDALYVFDNQTFIKIYGRRIGAEPEMELSTSKGYFLKLIDKKKYLVIMFNLSETIKVVVFKYIYNENEIEERKFREVYELLSKNEERFGEEIPFNLRLSLAILYLAMIILAIIVAIFLSRQISYPIVYLAEATKRVTEGKFDTRLNMKSEGEIDILIQNFNIMIDELQTLRTRLLHNSRIAAWQEVARRLAHEIKNPLTPIQLSAERILRKIEQKNLYDLQKVAYTSSKTIIEQVNVLKHLLEEFTNFLRLPSAKREYQSIVPIVKESAELFKNVSNILIEVRYQENLPELLLDKNLLIIMMNNLLKNAIEAIEVKFQDQNQKKGVILITITENKKFGRRFVLLKIEDNGIGIPENMTEKIFEPYFSTKEDYGTGLGLALVERAVLEHNARIQVMRSSLGGAEFRIYFPVI